MAYRIFPAIGIARVGEDDDFFLGPEIPGSGPGELLASGATTPVTRFKNADRARIRKQGARFHLFETTAQGEWVEAQLPPGATIVWTVHLVNKKAAVDRGASPPTVAARPQVVDASLVIDGGQQTINGANQTSGAFRDTFTAARPGGATVHDTVELGVLRTDGLGRLIVLGGRGRAGAPAGEPLGQSPNTYFKNPRWYDDVSDGPVTAVVRLADGTVVPVDGGAWVIVGPPDYAPAIDGVVTLYDVLTDIGIVHFGHSVPAIPSFDRDILPLLTRVRRLHWVHDNAAWSAPHLASPNLRSTALQDQPLRSQARKLVLFTEAEFDGHTSAQGPPFRLRDHQRKALDLWVAGTFDPTPTPQPNAVTAEGLTRAALTGAVGQGFCPGIEAGILLLDHTLYSLPFDYRIKADGSVLAGDLTALMAQPWQADFLECHTEWWPTQRPDRAPQLNGMFEEWGRGATATHRTWSSTTDDSGSS